MRAFFLILAMVVGMTGCMGGGTQDMQARRAAWEAQQQTVLQQAKASDEAGILPDNWQKLVEDYIRGQLRAYP